MDELYFSVDIETDGPSPGKNSMLSIGVVCLGTDHDFHLSTERGTFYRTLVRLPEATPDNDVMTWWDQFPEQWVETRRDPLNPADVMRQLEAWVTMMVAKHTKTEKVIPLLVAGPIVFDGGYLSYYMHRFLGRNVFGHNGIDLRSLGMGLAGGKYLTAKGDRPEAWISPLPHTHNALDDAKQQGDQFVRMVRWGAVQRDSKET